MKAYFVHIILSEKLSSYVAKNTVESMPLYVETNLASVLPIIKHALLHQSITLLK